MTIEELAEKVEIFITESRANHASLLQSQQKLNQRLNTIDLNGAAAHLRDFGYFLAEHPDFMKREAKNESQRVRRQIALEWIAEVFHLKDFRKKLAWVGSLIIGSALLSFGTSLVQIVTQVINVIHYLGHALFK